MAAKKILLVDDNKEFVEVTKTLLEANGFEVITAYSGQEGKDKITSSKPDLVILDVMMETQTAGFDVARWMRSREDSKRIPIIMLTAVNQVYPFNFAPDEVWLPVDVFLEKPVDPQRLLAEAEKITGGGRVRPRADSGRK